MFQVNNHELEQNEPWSGILSSVIFAMQSTIHTTTQATPMQLVFRRDTIMSLTYDTYWHKIKQRTKNLINPSNAN